MSNKTIFAASNSAERFRIEPCGILKIYRLLAFRADASPAPVLAQFP